jgi:hypothetical protein
MNALRRAWHADRWLTLAFVVLAIATCTPIWIGRYLPLLDLPNHLANIAVWHSYDDPRFDFAHYYTLYKGFLPYWAHYEFCHLLAYVVSVENANKIFLTVYALALPLGTLAFARRFERSPYLALFAFPIVWNFNLADGFVSYCGGMAAMVWGLWVVDKHCEKPTLRTALAVLAIGSAQYFFHILSYMFFLVAAGLLVFAQRRPFRIRHLVERGVPVVASCAVGVWAWLYERSPGYASIHKFPQTPRLPGDRNLIFGTVPDNIAGVPQRLMNLLASSRDEWVLVVLAAAWLVIALTAARDREPDPRRPFSARALGPELCFLVAALGLLLLPVSMHKPFYWYMINGRLIPVAAIFFALLVRGPVRGWRRALFVPVVAASLFYAVDLSRMVVVFNRHVDGFDALVDEIPLHKATLTLSLPPLGDPEVNVHAFNQWGSYVQIRRGGFNFYNFNYGFPLRYIRWRRSPPWNHVEMFNFEFMGQDWDYFLTHNEGIEFSIFQKWANAGQVRLVDARGSWKLWQRVGPPAIDPPITDVPVNQ